MKNFTLIIILLFTLFITLQAVEPERFIPRQSPSVVRLNINRLLTEPELKKSLNDNKEIKKIVDSFDELLRSCGEKELKLSDIFSGQLFLAQTGKKSEDCTIYLQTRLAENKLKKLLEHSTGEVISTTAAGKNVYIFKKHKNKDIAGVYLSEDVIMLTALNKQLPMVITASLQGGGNQLLSKLDGRSLAAGVADVNAVIGKKHDIKFVRGKLDVDKQLNLSTQILLITKDAEDAMKMAMQLQLAVPAMTGMLFSQDPDLVDALSNGLQITAGQDTVEIKFNLSYADCQKLAKLAASKKKRKTKRPAQGTGQNPAPRQ